MGENIFPLLLALVLAFIIVGLLWPEKIHPATQYYLDLLSPTEWKEESEIYEKALKFHPNLTPNQSQRILRTLRELQRIEQYIPPARDIEEIKSVNRFGNVVYKDHIEPFCTIQAVLYKKRVNGPNDGRRNWHKLIRHAFA
ncbi:MAG: hypothetical protein ACAH17_00500 [Candidatus Paceibacterota bacterium]